MTIKKMGLILMETLRNHELQITWQNYCEFTTAKKVNLQNDQVHIWRIDINQHLNDIINLLAILDNKEKQQAQRFKFNKDRNCLICSHAILRILLSKYLACVPKSITYEYNQYGKPMLSNNNNKLHFNLSHSHQKAIIAITKDNPIGIDIEYMQTKQSLAEIAKRFFAAQEYHEYKQLPNKQKIHGFYNAWTRKEAFVKAIGEGITHPLKNFVVNLTPGTNAKILSIKNHETAPQDWQLHSFTVAEKYCAALAWEGTTKQLNFYNY
jgi:4'-phosphopantetheinyl transferase